MEAKLKMVVFRMLSSCEILVYIGHCMLLKEKELNCLVFSVCKVFMTFLYKYIYILGIY